MVANRECSKQKELKMDPCEAYKLIEKYIPKSEGGKPAFKQYTFEQWNQRFDANKQRRHNLAK